jgi:ornithine cyclodeaminase/alanine dehydrogenase-like protein (mu-crystallin family)
VRAPAFLDAAEIARRLSPGAAVDALEAALRGGLDPDADPARISVTEGGGRGDLLVMPSSAAGSLGVKLASVAPANPEAGLPRIQGVYVLFDPVTLAPAAMLDGIALTALRTSAVSALAVRHLAEPDASRLLVFGTGPQAWAHVEAMRAVRPVERVDVVARDAEGIERFVRRCLSAGLAAARADTDAVPSAELICCCTTARRPLFDGDRVAERATVVAVGSHEPDAREVDERLVGRATVVVESRTVALSEAGDVIAPILAGTLAESELVTLDSLVRGEAAIAAGRPRLFKSSGMAWEDLVVAAAVVRAGPGNPG